MANLKFTPRNLAEALRALGARTSLVIGNNTSLELSGDRTEVYATLHGNRIVRYDKDGVSVSWAGWASSTTRDRINQLSNVRANISKGEPHLNGECVSAFGWYAAG